jgi:hypothetical protein
MSDLPDLSARLRRYAASGRNAEAVGNREPDARADAGSAGHTRRGGAGAPGGGRLRDMARESR